MIKNKEYLINKQPRTWVIYTLNRIHIDPVHPTGCHLKNMLMSYVKDSIDVINKHDIKNLNEQEQLLVTLGIVSLYVNIP